MKDAIERRELRKAVQVYRPLVAKPDLFLRFARLADEGKLDIAATKAKLDTDKNAATAEEWAKEHGVLGLAASVENGVLTSNTRGGKTETIAGFAYEAWVANGCLQLYEAATAEELDMELIASYIADPRHKLHYTTTRALAREWALKAVAHETQTQVAGNAYPALYGEVGRFVAGWSFANLLGAMWLQNLWLLTATEAPRRCRWCDNIIDYDQPSQPQGKKPKGRKKEKFCNKTCANAYRYRTTTKPRRQAARAG
jgi:hypothetical protein